MPVLPFACTAVLESSHPYSQNEIILFGTSLSFALVFSLLTTALLVSVLLVTLLILHIFLLPLLAILSSAPFGLLFVMLLE